MLGSDFGGLSKAKAERRLAQFGWNELQKKKRTSPPVMLLRQFTSFLVLLLIAAAVVSLILGDQVEAIVIKASVVLAGVLGFIQEQRAERALEALKKVAAPPTASVMRDDEEHEIPAGELVPGTSSCSEPI